MTIFVLSCYGSSLQLHCVSTPDAHVQSNMSLFSLRLGPARVDETRVYKLILLCFAFLVSEQSCVSVPYMSSDDEDHRLCDSALP